MPSIGGCIEITTTCSADCNGVLNGRPANRFSCGFDDGGPYAVPCADSRCTQGDFDCTDVPVSPGSFCCGDFVCEGSETCGNCALDCTLGPEICDTGIDEDCNGAVDCDDGTCTGESP